VNLAIDGPAAPPRSNGELVFTEPWESRAFGMAVTLSEGGAFTWDVFQSALIARIAASTGEWNYYQEWLAALEDVLADTITADEIDTRADALSTRPAGHDHREA
jgi:nitrile hydratase accessory protein